MSFHDELKVTNRRLGFRQEAEDLMYAGRNEPRTADLDRDKSRDRDVQKGDKAERCRHC